VRMKMDNQDDVIIIGQNSIGFNVICGCGKKHYHAIESFTSKCPECTKKKKYIVKDLPEFILHTLKNPIWLAWLKFQTKDRLRVQSNEFNRQKQADYVKGWESLGLRVTVKGYKEGYNRNKNKKIPVYEIELKKGIF
jgi:hypothetical protein